MAQQPLKQPKSPSRQHWAIACWAESVSKAVMPHTSLMRRIVIVIVPRRLPGPSTDEDSATIVREPDPRILRDAPGRPEFGDLARIEHPRPNR